MLNGRYAAVGMLGIVLSVITMNQGRAAHIFTMPSIPTSGSCILGDIMEEKKCTKCGEVKPSSCFSKDRKLRSGLMSRCKKCMSAYFKVWYATNKNSPEWVARKRLRGERRREHTLRKFGLTSATYDALLEKQKGVCAICKKPEEAERKGRVFNLAVDHNHRTGKIRGLLCCRCNRLLGRIENNPDWLAQALEYLEKERRR